MAMLMTAIPTTVYAESETPDYSEYEPEAVSNISLPTPKEEIDENGNKSYHYDIGSQTTGLDTVTTGSLELSNKSTLGIYNGEVLQTLKFGKYNYETGHSGNVYTNELKVNGTLTLNNFSSVAVGGQYRYQSKNWLGKTETHDKYVGITAKAVTVNDYASLISGRAYFDSLTVNDNAYVSIHGDNDNKETEGNTEYTGGNSKGDGIAALGDIHDKQTHITGAISVNNHASVTFGVDNGQNPADLSKHYLNYLNGKITQTSDALVKNEETGEVTANESSLSVKGKTFISGKLNIEQSGGNMDIAAASSFIRLSESKGNSIKQTTGGSMKIGKLVCGAEGNNNSAISIEQQGSGTIELLNGVTFTSNDNNHSTITQTSTVNNGTIKLKGDFSSAIFDITQDGANGKICIEANSTLKTSEVSIAGTLENNGTINGTEDSLLEIVGGKVENNGSIYMNISMTGGELTAADGSTFADITATSGTIYLGDNLTLGTLTLGGDAIATATFDLRSQQNGVIVYVGEGGALVDDLKIKGDNVTFVAKTDGTLADITEPLTLFRSTTDGTDYDLSKAKLVIEDSTGEKTEVAFTDNHDGTVTVTGSIPEPTTATLSLLALAALASRRRRK